MKKLIFHSFRMGDVEDPEIYVAQPLYEWEQTEQGQWVMKHCAEPKWTIHPDNANWGHRVVIGGELEDQDATYYTLKWGKFEPT